MQVEIHPHWRNDELREYCASESIHVSAYCPLGEPNVKMPLGAKNIFADIVRGETEMD